MDTLSKPAWIFAEDVIEVLTAVGHDGWNLAYDGASYVWYVQCDEVVAHKKAYWKYATIDDALTHLRRVYVEIRNR